MYSLIWLPAAWRDFCIFCKNHNIDIEYYIEEDKKNIPSRYTPPALVSRDINRFKIFYAGYYYISQPVKSADIIVDTVYELFRQCVKEYISSIETHSRKPFSMIVSDELTFDKRYSSMDDVLSIMSKNCSVVITGYIGALARAEFLRRIFQPGKGREYKVLAIERVVGMLHEEGQQTMKVLCPHLDGYDTDFHVFDILQAMRNAR